MLIGSPLVPISIEARHKIMKVRRLSDEEFTASRVRWKTLLDDSDANPVFMSWDWQHAWWRTYRAPLDAKLALFVVENDCGDWLGAAPLFLSDIKYKRLISSRVLQPIGATWRRGIGVVSEYLDILIASSADRDRVRETLIDALFANTEWDEFTMSYLPYESKTRAALDEAAVRAGTSAAYRE